jgi:hypothetical protein
MSGSKLLLLEQADGLHRLVHHVDRIIHRLDQILDVAAVERCDEAAAHGQQHLAGDIVRLVLQRHDARAVPFGVCSRVSNAFSASARRRQCASVWQTDRRTGLRVA